MNIHVVSGYSCALRKSKPFAIFMNERIVIFVSFLLPHPFVKKAHSFGHPVEGQQWQRKTGSAVSVLNWTKDCIHATKSKYDLILCRRSVYWIVALCKGHPLSQQSNILWQKTTFRHCWIFAQIWTFWESFLDRSGNDIRFSMKLNTLRVHSEWLRYWYSARQRTTKHEC